MKVLVTGDRNWQDRGMILRELLALKEQLRPGEQLIVVHGKARGADSLAAEVARAHHWTMIERGYAAEWGRYGRAAGPIRNQQMLDLEHCPYVNEPIDLVLAFHDDLPSSRGTADMVARARKLGIEVRHLSHVGATV